MITLKPVKVNAERIGIMGYRVAVENFGTMSLNDVANLITVNNTVTRTDVLAVVSAMMTVVQQDLVRGYNVSLGDLGTIQIKVQSKGTDTKEAWGTDKIVGTRVKFVPSTALKRAIAKGAYGINMRMA